MRRTLYFLLILINLLSLSGCRTLRQKFIRKKEVDKEQPVYVDFKDYPQRPTEEAYVDYYLFTRGWLEELKESLRGNISYKRNKRAIDEAIMNIEQIISFYNEEGREALSPLYEDLKQTRDRIERGPSISEVTRNRLIKKIENIKRRFESNFNYAEAKKWMD